MASIEWVNHASFILKHAGVSLITDPWIEGAAFNNGWSLLSPTRLRYADFEGITHIWFSHEHPDHFSPPNLKKIPELIRRSITVLFHQTRDKRVVRFCGELGFKTIELEAGQWVDVGESFSIICTPNGMLDSWLGIRVDNQVLLNMNDCVGISDSGLREIARTVGSVDVLLTQFSYAGWVGNRTDSASHIRNASEKKDQIRQQITALSPKVVIPFASFVVFDHTENWFMNDAANRIGDISSYIEKKIGIPSVVLYPGESWTIGALHDNAPAIRAYETDERTARERGPRHSALPVQLEELRSAHDAHRKKVASNNRAAVLRLIRPTVAWLTDLNLPVRISYWRTLETTGDRVEDCDIRLSAESLKYCYSVDWGSETLGINGRYEEPRGGSSRRFFWYFRPSNYNASGHSLGFRFLVEQVRRRVGRTLGL